MSVARNISVYRHSHQHLSPQTAISISGNTWNLHKQRISIGKDSISIRTLCKPPLFRQKYGRRRVSKKAIFLSFCREKRQKLSRKPMASAIHQQGFPPLTPQPKGDNSFRFPLAPVNEKRRWQPLRYPNERTVDLICLRACLNFLQKVFLQFLPKSLFRSVFLFLFVT